MRTAVIRGTAAVTSTAIWRRHAVMCAGPLASPLPAEPPPSGITADRLSLLELLGELPRAEVLSAEEFEVQKARILGSAL